MIFFISLKVFNQRSLSLLFLRKILVHFFLRWSRKRETSLQRPKAHSKSSKNEVPYTSRTMSYFFFNQKLKNKLFYKILDKQINQYFMSQQSQNQNNPANYIIEGELVQREQNINNQNSSQNPEIIIPSAFQKILAFMHLPVTKTPYCKHKMSCLQSILRDSAKITAVSYLVKSGMSSVFGIKKIFSNPINLLKILVGKDSINFGLFVGSFVLLFRSVLCIARRYLSQNFHRYIPLFAGLFGGLISILFLQKKSRQTFALFLFARAIDITYNNLVKKGYLPEFKYFYVVLYSLMMGITGYVYGTEPGSMSPEMNKFYLTFTNETLSDMQMRQIWIQRKNNYLAKRGIPRQDPLEYMPKLKKYYESIGVKK